jgi:hypothetical protein
MPIFDDVDGELEDGLDDELEDDESEEDGSLS